MVSANPAALMLAQVLSQLLESNLEGHLDETWRVLDFFCRKKFTTDSQKAVFGMLDMDDVLVG